MKLKFVWIGTTKSPPCRYLEADYLSRIKKYCPAAIVTVREGKKTDPRQEQRQLKLEANRVKKALDEVSFVACLDEKGRHRSSRELSSWLNGLGGRGHREVAFVVGGHFGLPSPIRILADEVLSLGRMTLPHELARVVLLEQVFRGFCILKHVPYHRG